MQLDLSVRAGKTSSRGKGIHNRYFCDESD